MVKFKVYSIFLAFIYSFFFYTLTHKNHYSGQVKTFAESQVRIIERKSEDVIITLLRASNTVKTLPTRGQTPLNPKGIIFHVDNINTIKNTKIKVENSILYRSIATERYRVLRN